MTKPARAPASFTRMRPLAAGACALMLAAAPCPVRRAWADASEDAFAAGYVTAILERELEVEPLSVKVHDGAVVVEIADTQKLDVERLKTLLEGVKSVRSLEVRTTAAPSGQTTTAAPAEAAPAPQEAAKVEIPAAPAGEEGEAGTVFLPRGHLFDPLLADPRWPRFAASYQNYFGDPELDDIAAVNLGGEFPLLRWDGPADGRMQLGLQGGIFAIFALDTDSKDLVNADYRIGLPLTYRRGNWTALARLFHQSSHLGDEFLLRNRVERINLSYEAVDVIGSYELWDALRPYVGAGYLFDQDPSDLDPWWTQAGAELTSPRAFFDFMRPLIATDLQFHEENGWETDLSLRAGVQLESPRLESQRMYLLAEYYDGRNPNGQFFDRNVEYAGIGIHGHF